MPPQPIPSLTMLPSFEPLPLLCFKTNPIFDHRFGSGRRKKIQGKKSQRIMTSMAWSQYQCHSIFPSPPSPHSLQPTYVPPTIHSQQQQQTTTNNNKQQTQMCQTW